MNVWKFLLKAAHWRVGITAPRRDKCVICVAPHTSNWDFVVGITAYKSLGREANFLMKDFWFFFPLKYLLRALGGIPVSRKGKGGGSLTEKVVDLFRTRRYVNLAVTPEGTRSLTDKWHTGFLYIAYGAGVPIQLGVIDYANRIVIIKEEYEPTGNSDADMAYIRNYYSKFSNAARYPKKFKS